MKLAKTFAAGWSDGQSHLKSVSYGTVIQVIIKNEIVNLFYGVGIAIGGRT